VISQVAHSAAVPPPLPVLCRRAGVVKMERPQPAFFAGEDE
jgi:hypothetical protein